jgi:hypothetical protein
VEELNDNTSLPLQQKPQQRGLSDPKLPQIGHVASLAVNKKFRSMGVAQGMMRTLHSNLAAHHLVDSVSLYCRVRLTHLTSLYPVVLSPLPCLAFS